MTRLNRRAFVRALKSQLEDKEAYAPLRIEHVAIAPESCSGKLEWSDFEIKLTWREREVCFAARIQTQSAPRQVKNALRDLKERWSEMESENHPLLTLPYISASVADLFKEKGGSGLDLSGNYILQTDDFVAIRLDQEKKYKESGGIKNVFRGTSSVVCRYLLYDPGPHETVTGIHRGIRELDGQVSLSTVSKVLSTLNEMLIIEKGDCIQVLQPEKLLRRLCEQYRRPSTTESIPLNLPRPQKEKEAVLTELLGDTRWVWSGATSAERYATTTPAQENEAYTRTLPLDSSRFDAYRDKRFYNCMLHESKEDFVYFGHNGHWASEVQTYLDLMQGDKREREIAQDLEARILRRHNADTTNECI